jgi:hypothetical protein
MFGAKYELFSSDMENSEETETFDASFLPVGGVKRLCGGMKYLPGESAFVK